MNTTTTTVCIGEIGVCPCRACTRLDFWGLDDSDRAIGFAEYLRRQYTVLDGKR